MKSKVMKLGILLAWILAVTYITYYFVVPIYGIICQYLSPNLKFNLIEVGESECKLDMEILGLKTPKAIMKNLEFKFGIGDSKEGIFMLRSTQDLILGEESSVNVNNVFKVILLSEKYGFGNEKRIDKKYFWIRAGFQYKISILKIPITIPFRCRYEKQVSIEDFFSSEKNDDSSTFSFKDSNISINNSSLEYQTRAFYSIEALKITLNHASFELHLDEDANCSKNMKKEHESMICRITASDFLESGFRLKMEVFTSGLSVINRQIHSKTPKNLVISNLCVNYYNNAYFNLFTNSVSISTGKPRESLNQPDVIKSTISRKSVEKNRAKIDFEIPSKYLPPIAIAMLNSFDTLKHEFSLVMFNNREAKYSIEYEEPLEMKLHSPKEIIVFEIDIEPSLRKVSAYIELTADFCTGVLNYASITKDLGFLLEPNRIDPHYTILNDIGGSDFLYINRFIYEVNRIISSQLFNDKPPTDLSHVSVDIYPQKSCTKIETKTLKTPHNIIFSFETVDMLVLQFKINELEFNISIHEASIQVSDTAIIYPNIEFNINDLRIGETTVEKMNMKPCACCLADNIMKLQDIYYGDIRGDNVIIKKIVGSEMLIGLNNFNRNRIKIGLSHPFSFISDGQTTNDIFISLEHIRSPDMLMVSALKGPYMKDRYFQDNLIFRLTFCVFTPNILPPYRREFEFSSSLCYLGCILIRSILQNKIDIPSNSSLISDDQSQMAQTDLFAIMNTFKLHGTNCCEGFEISGVISLKSSDMLNGYENDLYIYNKNWIKLSIADRKIHYFICFGRIRTAGEGNESYLKTPDGLGNVLMLICSCFLAATYKAIERIKHTKFHFRPILRNGSLRYMYSALKKNGAEKEINIKEIVNSINNPELTGYITRLYESINMKSNDPNDTIKQLSYIMKFRTALRIMGLELEDAKTIEKLFKHVFISNSFVGRSSNFKIDTLILQHKYMTDIPATIIYISLRSDNYYEFLELFCCIVSIITPAKIISSISSVLSEYFSNINSLKTLNRALWGIPLSCLKPLSYAGSNLFSIASSVSNKFPILSFLLFLGNFMIYDDLC